MGAKPTPGGANSGAALLAPGGVAERIAVPPVLVSPAQGWDGVTVQRFRGLPRTIDIPGMGNDVLVAHLAGPFLAEASDGAGRFQRQWINPGDLGVNPVGSCVHREIRGKPDVALVHLDPATVRAVGEEMTGADPARLHLVPTLGEPDAMAGRLIRLLLVEAENPGLGAPLLVQALSRALIVHVLRTHSNAAPRGPDRPAGLSPRRVRVVVEYMQAHMEEALSIGALAKAGGMSPSRFVRAFRDATGQPPHQYLVGLRLERARHLLEHTDLSVTEVGLRCGFGHPSHFATMFRATTGLAPRAWRLHRRA